MVKHVDQQKSIQIIQKRNLGFGNDKWMKQRTYFRGKAVREMLQYVQDVADVQDYLRTL